MGVVTACPAVQCMHISSCVRVEGSSGGTATQLDPAVVKPGSQTHDIVDASQCAFAPHAMAQAGPGRRRGDRAGRLGARARPIGSGRRAPSAAASPARARCSGRGVRCARARRQTEAVHARHVVASEGRKENGERESESERSRSGFRRSSDDELSNRRASAYTVGDPRSSATTGESDRRPGESSRHLAPCWAAATGDASGRACGASERLVRT